MEWTTAQQVFTVLLASGIVMIALEVFLPGGILGAIGAVALAAAIVVGFRAFPAYGALVAIGILVFSAIVLVLWLKIAPDTWIGRKLTISRDLVDAKATKPGLDELIGQKGTALCPLRPAGFAKIGGRRVDVVTQGEMVDKDEPIQVIDVESNRVIVKKV